ncbi:MAG: alanine racemase [Alphaproteobacteria bacterium]|nr:alanine racemase [Alphaproteobacteria bacterium]
MPVLTRPVLEINLPALLDNYYNLQKLAPNAIAAAVVKDDAYGLGAEEVSAYLYKYGNCRHFFVAHAVEGANIRSQIPEAIIYVLQGMGDDNVSLFKRYNLTPVISSSEQLIFWKQNRITDIKPVVHIETGLNRLGFREQDLAGLSTEDIAGFGLVMSHLACADVCGHFMNVKQLDNFIRLRNQYFKDIPASLSASDGVFLGEEYHFDMVRLGAAMYGINTAPNRPNTMKAIVTVKAPVLEIAPLAQGEYVGYSATYRADTQRNIAIVSIGYGDGYPRSLSNVGKVYLHKNHQRSEIRVIGRVSMDNLICDVTGISNIEVGDMVNILDDTYTLDNIGQDAGTISYEILSRIGKNTRFERRYLK